MHMDEEDREIEEPPLFKVFWRRVSLKEHLPFLASFGHSRGRQNHFD